MILLIIGDISNNAESRKREEDVANIKANALVPSSKPTSAGGPSIRTDPFPQLKSEAGNWKAKPRLEGERKHARSAEPQTNNDCAEAKHESAAP